MRSSAVLPIDSIHTPIKNVKYSVENYRVEQKTDYEKLNIEVTTDGSHPSEGRAEGGGQDTDPPLHALLRTRRSR